MAFEIVWTTDVLNLVKEADANAALAAFTVPQQDLILAEAYLEVPEFLWDKEDTGSGGWTRILRTYWAAHIAVQSTIESAGEGANTSENIGSVSSSNNQSVNNPSAKEGDLETHYGRTYFNYRQKLRGRNIVAFGTVTGGQSTGFKKNIPC